MGKYIDGSGLSHFMGIIKGAFAVKADAIKNITRSGTTFTATRADGTTFTFTQQDNTVAKTSTTPKMDGTAAIGTETKYAAGDHVHPSDTSRVPTTRKVNGKALSSDVTLTGEDIEVMDGEDTIANVLDNLESDITNGLAGKVDKVSGKDLSTNDYTTAEKNKLAGIATGAEVNQNAFSNVKVGTTTVAADAKTDTLELAGSNVTLTPDATNDKVTIGITASNVTTALGNTAVARATGDASGNNISNTYATKDALSTYADNVANTYAPKASPALTGTPTAPTAAAGTSTTQIATTAFVANAVGTATAGALNYKGVATKESDITGQAYKKGWYYVVSTAGTYFGKACEVGDMLIAKQDKTSTPANDWDIVQSNLEVLSNDEIDALWTAA